MDFFQRQDQARKNTKLLVFYFILAVIAIVAAVYLAVLVILFGAASRTQRHGYYDAPAPAVQVWRPELLLGIGAGVLGIITCGSAYKTMQLSGGGGCVAESLGGRPVAPNTIDPNERKLLNVVEEMAIASGVPMPQVYVLDEEPGINAFAAGHTPSDAAIGVTRGCITTLKRDELQGVIGHEFSHILNGDMRLNLRLLGIIFGILCIATIGRILLRARSGNSRDKNPLPLLGLALLLIGGIGVFFGRLIQAAVSRQREFLADASAVQFTRNPDGLSGALQKIGGYSHGSRLESEHAADVAHLFFGNGIAEPFLNLFATHPPIAERIKAIAPAWDGKFPALAPEQIELVENAAIADLKASRSPVPSLLREAGVALAGNESVTWRKPPVITATTVLPNLGQPTPLHLKYAEQLHNALPENLKLAAREPLDAVALIYALLLSHDDGQRAAQLQQLASLTAPAIHAKTAALFPEVTPIAARTRLPLASIALPALRRLRANEFTDFFRAMQWLVESDGQVELFEFVLQKIIHRHLASQFEGTRHAVVQFYSLKPLLPDCAVLLSALAHVGSDDEEQNLKAFAAGAPYLRAPEGGTEFLPVEDCGLNQIDAALNRLDQAAPQIKKNLLEACVRVVGADGVIQEGEAELLRAVADTLDCPIPPFVTTE
ncbi:MAG: M48 family metallopeptidase [Verrucomicrobia bacterium]|nr:M48 family metallopeptidase [Verrucomicrobiota bacterium]